MMFLTTTDPTAVTEPLMDAESLKKLMDGFDPAALLPELDNMFGTLDTICRWAVMIGPVVLLVLGLCYLFLSPKEANYYFGYRTYFGMGSVNAWRFTQRIAGMIFTALGLVLTVVMLVIIGGFGAMEVSAMVYRAIWCLVWEAILAILATVSINSLAMYFFDRKGEYRRKPKK
ncbi:MAG: SdpI family protein [Eubacteriales bacterium]|nr:SdpI family protein [Eubacteriales bacterium]